VNNLHALPGGGPSGMGMSSSVSSSSSSFEVPGGGPSGIRISSSVSSAYKRINCKGSMLERMAINLLPPLVHSQEQPAWTVGCLWADVEDDIPVSAALGVLQGTFPSF
jgi:hypothetical protein